MSSSPKWTYAGPGRASAPLTVTLTELQIGRIQRDGLQARAEGDEAHVAALAEAYADVQQRRRIPPVIVFSGYAPDADGKFTSGCFLADGHHRVAASLRAGLETIRADVRTVAVTKDARRAALLYAVGANQDHGLRRTNADKRHAVEVLLADPEWSQWSDRQIAKATGVSHTFVANMRPAQLATVASSSEADAAPDEADKAAPAAEQKRVGADGKARALPKPRPKPEPAHEPYSEPAPAPAPASEVGETDDSLESPAAGPSVPRPADEPLQLRRAQVAAEVVRGTRDNLAATVSYLDATAPDLSTLTAEEREEQIGTLTRIRDAAAEAQKHAAEIVSRCARALRLDTSAGGEA